MRIMKYQATGNDFILVDHVVDNPSAFARAVCDRHFGIGADGILMAISSNEADIEMSYYNSDGTIAPMCGNGMRAFAHFVYHHQLIKKPTFTVKTLAGLIDVSVNNDQITIDLGTPILALEAPHVSKSVKNLAPVRLYVDNQAYDVSVLFLGTLHALLVVNDVSDPRLIALGDALCHHPFFPSRINVNFIEVVNQEAIKVLTFERGAGLTLSCGTGVSASAYYAHRILGLNNHLNITVRGGNLSVLVDTHVLLTGPAKKIASIDYEVTQ